MCVVLCLGCEGSSDTRAEAGDAGAPPDASSDAAPDTMRPDGGGRGTPFLDCEAETISRAGENVAFECERCGPNGTCPEPDPAQGECRCFPGHEGERCELCTEGYVEHGGTCVTPCEAAGMPCTGLCSGTVDAPTCDCAIGYDGARCDTCSPGFEPDPRVFDALACAPTCGGACAAEELCTAASRDQQRCECMVGYDRDAADDCVWLGFTADPGFEHGCEHWRLLRRVANPTDVVVAELAPSELRLSVDHTCSAAGARAEAFLPAAHSKPGAALAITASGNAGASLQVSIDGQPGPFLASPGGERLVGTGAFERYVVCLALGDRGRKAAITLSVGELGACADAVEIEFVVRSLEVTVDAKCEG